MLNLFNNYKLYEPVKVCFLDSKYIDEVLKEYPGYNRKYIQCTITDNNIEIDTNGIKINLYNKNDMLVKLKLKIYNPETNDYDYHVNLLIFNAVLKTILRFEPMEISELDDIINPVLISRFSKSLPQFTYSESSYHPQFEDQDCKNLGLCVAHVIKFGICYVLHCDDQDEDIYRFCNAIVSLY